MTRNAWLRCSVLSLLLLVPLASPADAAEKAPARQRDRGFIAWISNAVVEIRKILLPGITAKTDSHGGMDPDGLTSIESGPGMDPDGRT